MKLLFLVYLATGCIFAPFKKDLPKHHALNDWLIFFAMHIPALLLTVIGIWQTKKEGKFMGMDLPLFLIAAAATYLIGLVGGFYIAI